MQIVFEIDTLFHDEIKTPPDMVASNRGPMVILGRLFELTYTALES